MQFVRMERTGSGSAMLPVPRSAVQTAGKFDGFYRPDAPPFPEESSIPQGSQDDLPVSVRLAVETRAILVTTDGPLKKDLESSGIQAKYSLEVLTPQEALGRLDG